ncbi:MAG: isopentenyl-diphosphate Delta-isomerase [Hyphomicrobiales bacterium]
MNKEHVVLVDNNDNDLGQMEKMEAHIKGILHRAFSIFILNSRNEMLIHKRALTKYHSPGLWTNACCSHPRKNENVLDAGHRRLQEEMGFDCNIKEIFTFIYKADVGDGLIEHEYDHVLFGLSDIIPNINPDEVDSYKYVDINKLSTDIKLNPQNYTEWFKIAYKEFLIHLNTINK